MTEHLTAAMIGFALVQFARWVIGLKPSAPECERGPDCRCRSSFDLPQLEINQVRSHFERFANDPESLPPHQRCGCERCATWRRTHHFRDVGRNVGELYAGVRRPEPTSAPSSGTKVMR